MSSEFQNSIQTLKKLNDADQQTISQLQSQVESLKSQLETLQTLFSVSDLKAIRERAKSENLSVDAFLKDIIVAALDKSVRAIYVDDSVYTKLSDLAASRNIDIDTLLTRSGTTEFLLNAIQNGRF